MPTHYLRATDEFEVDWDDAALPERRWNLDREHNHGTLKRFEVEASVLSSEIAMSIESIVVNGHVYTGSATMPAPPKEMRRQHYAEMWNGTYLGEAIAQTEPALQRDHSQFSDEALALELPEDLRRSALGLRATQSPLFRMFLQTHPFAVFCRERFGDPDGLLLQYRMLQGRETETTTGALMLERIAERVASTPEFLAALEDGNLDEARSRPDSGAFFAVFDEFIDRYGWRASIWSDLTTPTWAEDPTTPLAMIRRYVENPETRPSVSLAAAADDRDSAIAQAMEQLGDDESRAQLQAFLDENELLPQVREGRAHWQLILAGMLRRPLMELGRRFVRRGLLDDPSDVLHLVSSELVALSRDQLDGRSLVAEHRAAYEHWQTLTPPDFIGSAERAPDPIAAMRQPEVTERVSADGKLHSGVPASAGVAYGRARIATELTDALAIEPGEVLVCRTTAPPWTPVFALASAVVTEGGDILSHSAIVAREYKIPAVLRIQEATARIPDGAMVTVDGNRGTVRLD